MRTTITIDEDVLAVARAFAEARRISLGKAVSELARRGVASRPATRTRSGFHIFAVDSGTPKFGLDEVEAALADDLSTAGNPFRSKKPANAR